MSSGRRRLAMQSVAALALASVAIIAGPARAQDVTFERLLNPEPENWLRDHNNFSNWRYSTLDQINRDNVGDLEVAYMFSIGGRATGGTLGGKEESTILVNNGMLYVADSWNRVMGFDVSSGRAAIPLWRWDPSITKSRTTRGVALYNDSVVASTNDTRIGRLNATTGEVIWETVATAAPDPTYGTPSADTQGFTAAPTVLRTAGGQDLVLQGESTGGQRGTISYVVALDFHTGDVVWRRYTIPFPGEPGHETWEDDHEAWRTGGAGVWQSPSFDPALNLVYYGTGDAMPTFDPQFRPGDNLYAASTIALDVDTGEIAWYFQETPNEQWDYDTPSPRMLYPLDGRNVVGNFSRNGFFYTHDRGTGEFISAGQYQLNVNWTAGIDDKTGLPVDYVAGAGVQDYAGVGPRRGETTGDTCPTWSGAPAGLNPPSFDPTRMVTYLQVAEGCLGGATLAAWPDDAEAAAANGLNRVGAGAGTTVQRTQPAIPPVNTVLAYNVVTNETVARYTREGEPFGETGTMATAGNLVFAGNPRGDFVALDADTLQEVWSFNVGAEISAPPSTFSIDGKQYVAVLVGGDGSGLWQRSAMVVVWTLGD